MDIQHKFLKAAILVLTENNLVNRAKLNKLLYFSDTANLLRNKETITDSKYIKLPYGPVPEEIDAARNWLISKDYLSESRDANGIYFEYSYKANTDKVNIERVKETFLEKKGALDILDLVKNNFVSFTASDLSQKSHEFLPWKLASSIIDLDLSVKDEELKNWLIENNILTAKV